MSFLDIIFNLIIISSIVYVSFSIISVLFYIYHHGLYNTYHNANTGKYETKEDKFIKTRNFLYNELIVP